MTIRVTRFDDFTIGVDLARGRDVTEISVIDGAGRVLGSIKEWSIEPTDDSTEARNIARFVQDALVRQLMENAGA
jgi:hypothetical protein